MKKPKTILALSALTMMSLAVPGCEVEREGEMPEIEVEDEGRLPEIDVDMPDIDIREGTDTLKIPLPDIDVRPDTTGGTY